MRGWRRIAWGRRVLVNLRTGNAVAGTITAARGGVIELRGPNLILWQDGRPVDLDGSVVVDITNIDFVQVLPAEVPTTAPVPVREG